MVFQNYALYPNKTVFENLAFPLRMRESRQGRARCQVKRTANVLSIEHLLDRHPRQLSGGQQQRVALGRALVRNPQAFLMDEPLSNLDAKLRVQMRAELKRFHQELNATVIYVTHDQLEAVTMADRIAVMHLGVLQQYATPDEIYNRPLNTFVAGFIGSPAMNLLRGQVTTPDGQVAVAGESGWLLPLADAPGRRALAQQYWSRSSPGCATGRSGSHSNRRPGGWRVASTPSSRPATSPTSTQARRPPARRQQPRRFPRRAGRTRSGSVRPGSSPPLRRRDGAVARGRRDATAGERPAPRGRSLNTGYWLSAIG